MTEEHSHHRGLGCDLQALNRRQWLRAAAGAGVAALVGCDDEGGADEGGACPSIPEETAGPYPGDGSNGANALRLSGIVRGDIRASIAGATGVAEGVTLTIELTVVDGDCAPLAGYAVYLWHCDRGGNYSMYSAAVASENYLRGVQETDGAGKVRFTTIFPACYRGRWPHVHFEVYPSLAAATDSAQVVRTSQFALPESACESVFATAGYEASVANLGEVSLDGDNVFRDGVDLQMPGISGSVDGGYVATLTVAVSG